jgi:PAS domain S-box-containing protein
VAKARPAKPDPPSLGSLDEDAALRAILEGTATETGRPFFEALVRNLADALDVHAAMITEFTPEAKRLRTLGFCEGRKWIRDYEYEIGGTPCERVVDGVEFVHVTLAVFRIFAARAAAELRRLHAQEALQQRERKLARLLEGAMDGIVELDDRLRVTMMNRAAETLLGVDLPAAEGEDFGRFLTGGSHEKLARLVQELVEREEGRRSLWIPGGLQIRMDGGETVPAEATLSSYEVDRGLRHTLIIRDLNERLEAERLIETLTAEARYLREEISELHHCDEIIGRSGVLEGVLRDVQQVAGTDATVLLLGETGTGKELFARAIHDTSARRDHPLVKVNCAAVPEALIESEFFGHEKGAFTGATQRREGRFALADGGTIFLDEIGELPLELQSKLLRVLQEGEFEPVGSSRTQSVDVRVIAATNRDLERAVREGTFREDLFYRLNVFPIRLPPLRDRPEDIPLLAEVFLRRFAQKMGRKVVPLSEEVLRRLTAYRWPGNVRELDNVIERALITSPDGILSLDRALPVEGPAPVTEAASPPAADGRVRTAAELQQLERENILAALQQCDGRIAGDQGAAKLLGMPPSTLTSRLKALGIERPT